MDFINKTNTEPNFYPEEDQVGNRPKKKPKDKETLDFLYDYRKHRRVYHSLQQFDKDYNEMWYTYRRYANKVRLIYKNDLPTLQGLQLDTGTTYALSIWAMDAETFYMKAIGEPEIHKTLEKNGISLKELQRCLSIHLSLRYTEFFLDRNAEEEQKMEDQKVEKFEELQKLMGGLDHGLKRSLEDEPETYKMIMGLEDDEEDEE
ncbi:MAG: hypothetical protein GY765_12965 [bacterium]|nr:hypothetical protein [bacterium]